MAVAKDGWKILRVFLDGIGLGVFTFFISCFVLTFFCGFGRFFVETASTVTMAVLAAWSFWRYRRWNRPEPETSQPWWRRRPSWAAMINLSAAVFILFWLLAYLMFVYRNA